MTRDHFTHGCATIKTERDLMLEADAQRTADDARNSRTPAAQRDWTWAAAEARAALSMSAESMGVR